MSVASLPSRPNTRSDAKKATAPISASPATAAQVAATPAAGPRRTAQTSVSAPPASSTEISEVFEVLISTSRNDSNATLHQTPARRGFKSAAAAQIPAPIAMLSPKPFFSSQRPRQAPGKMSLIRPIDGAKRAAMSDATARMAKLTPSTSASRAHE